MPSFYRYFARCTGMLVGLGLVGSLSGQALFTATDLGLYTGQDIYGPTTNSAGWEVTTIGSGSPPNSRAHIKRAGDPGFSELFPNAYLYMEAAYGINDKNMVVGAWNLFYPQHHAYRVDANIGDMLTLDDYTDYASAGFTSLNDATRILDNGTIIGLGKVANGDTHVFQLTPVAPELHWDADGSNPGLAQGSGTWSHSSANWTNNTTGVSVAGWTDGGIARFYYNNSPSTVTVTDSITLEGIMGGYTPNGMEIAASGGGTLTFTGQAFIRTGLTGEKLIISAPIAGSAGLWIGGHGVTLTAANTYTGQTRVSGGTVEVTDGQALGATGVGNETVIEDGEVRMAASLTSNEGFILRGSYSSIKMQSDANRAVVLNGGILLEATGRLSGADRGDNSTLTVNGVISETGGAQDLVVAGATLTGTNTFTGDLVAQNEGVTVATLNDANVAGPLGAGLRLVLGYNGEGAQPGNLRYTGATAASNRGIHSEGGGQIDIVNAGTTLTLTGSITGNRGFEKAGPGTLVITGANTYTGQSEVSDGTLRLANLSGSALGTGNVRVMSGAVLTGPGSFTGNLLLQGEYQLGDPGATALVSLGGDLSLESGAWIVFSLGGLARGTQYDALDIAGQLGEGESGSGGIRANFINGFMPILGDSFNLLDWGSTTLTTLDTDLPVLAGGLAWDTSLLLTSGVISVSAIPEPSTYAALAGLAALGLVAWRRKRCTA